jgi:lysophospholipase L1-like esterase
MWRAEPDRNAALLLALSAALVAGTCSRESHLEPIRGPRAALAASAVPASSHGPSLGLTPPAPPSLPPLLAAGSLPPAGRLPRFLAALAGLQGKTRSEHVRVLWLGDSHTAADYMTGAFRRRLAAAYGVGGPGLLRLGIGAYRHTGVKLVREGRWRVEPTPPSSRAAEGDTALGFTGMRSVPADTRARVEARIDPRFVSEPVRYQLLFDLPSGSSFRVRLGKQNTLVSGKTEFERIPNSPLLRLNFEAAASDGLEIDRIVGTPRFHGVIAEGTTPGVVVDTSGIDGARFATALAWNADVLAAEVGARRPDLFVLAYGTNEAFDARRVDAYATEVSELVTRLRRGAPNADCLILGPPDAAAPDYTSLPRVAEIEAVLARTAAKLGCASYSLRESMGGTGSFVRWLRETPPLARGDRIHFTPLGYERMGEALADSVIASMARPPLK